MPVVKEAGRLNVDEEDKFEDASHLVELSRSRTSVISFFEFRLIGQRLKPPLLAYLLLPQGFGKTVES
jgi:hypothetical protein